MTAAISTNSALTHTLHFTKLAIEVFSTERSSSYLTNGVIPLAHRVSPRKYLADNNPTDEEKRGNNGDEDRR